MFVQLMKAKLHGGKVTEANIDYTGSIGIDSDLLRQSGMLPYERVQVLNLERGQRLETYIIPEKAGSGKLVINGAAAHHFRIGERILVIAYVLLSLEEVKAFTPIVLILNENNQIKELLKKGKED